MRSFLTRLRDRSTVTTLADLVGIGACTAGAALIYVPAGFITAGVLILAASITASREVDK